MTEVSNETADLRLLRIGIDARYLKRKGIGISRYLDEAICDLLNAGALVTLLTDTADHGAALHSEYPTATAVVLRAHGGFLWEQRILRRHLYTASYNAYIAPANYGIPLAYRGSTQLILVIHDLIPLRLPHLYLVPRPLWACKYLLSLAIAAIRADYVIAVSYATAGDVARLLRRSAKCVVYPPMPTPTSEGSAARNALHTNSDMADARIERRTGCQYFVYNGGADVRKNVPLLLYAFARVRSVCASIELVMLGTGYDSFRSIVVNLGIDEFVHMPGYVDEATKVQVIQGARAVIYPSRMEGFGLPIVEALSYGIPVVSGTGGSLREVGGAAVTYVHPLNEQALAAAMITVTRRSSAGDLRQAADIQLRMLRDHQRDNSFSKAVLSCVCYCQPPAGSRSP